MTEWQTIDSAPKDGTPIIIGWMPNGQLEYMLQVRWLHDKWCKVDDIEDNGWTPTHWTPTWYTK